jgi:nitrite reductase (NADH) large subunit
MRVPCAGDRRRAEGTWDVGRDRPGLELPGVSTFRDIADVETMIAAARAHERAVVIGGGLLGLEAAWGLKRRGMSVTVVHLMLILMERQLDAAAAELLRRDLASRGIEFVLHGETEEILGIEHAAGIRLADGSEIAADLVLLAIGTRPNIDLARAAGLDLNLGIVVGDDLGTSDKAIYAVATASSTTGRPLGWLRRYGNRPGSAPRAWPAIGRPPTSHRPFLPASRSPASMSFPRGR